MNIQIAIIASPEALPNLVRALAEIGGNTIVAIEHDTVTPLLASNADLFIVATPVDHRAATVLQILENTQAAVLVDTPMAMDEQEAETLRDAAVGRLAWVGHPLRFSPARRRMQRMLQEGVIGTPYRASSDLFLDGTDHENRSFDWNFDFTRGGGVLNQIGAHLLDLAEQEHGEIISVLSHLPTFRKQRADATGESEDVRVDDYLNMVANTENGFMVEVRASNAVPGADRNHSWCTGSKGTLHLHDETRLSLQRNGQAPTPVDLDAALNPVFGPTFDPITRCLPHLLEATLRAVDAKQTDFDGATSFEQGLRLQRILDAVRGSAFQRMWNGVFHEHIEEPIDLENPVL